MEKTIGKRIRECRVKVGMTQEELAEALITKKSTVSAYENDKIDIKISILKQAYELLQKQHVNVTDDASLVERLGIAVAVAEGSYENIKITTPEDLIMAENLCKSRGLVR